MGDELRNMPAWEVAALVKARTVSPVEVVEASLARIEALDPVLHAFITVATDRAVRRARWAEEAIRRGEDVGPLHGVPIALKDEAWTAGMPATAGSLLFKKFVPAHSGAVSERLERAGAVIIGKTNMPEFAAWPRSRSRLAGEAVNPWDPSRISGASSGGSAAAVAAGLVPVAIGSDGGGSTRIPSALCGVVGLYPTPGRVSCYGSFSYSPLGSLGPIARNVRDVALVEQVIAGRDPGKKR
jgi:Asp-tRNA(Asn)/Glu-tRNA(Gln) amidotransferase A subunit family amidase